MRPLKVDDDARYQPVPNACRKVNVGRNTLMRIAAEANAIVRIGKSVRIDMPTLFTYIDDVYRGCE